MRIVSLIPAAAVLFMSSGAFAAWVDYENRDFRFSINFPAQPKVEMTTQEIAGGKKVPATKFSVNEGTAHYSMIAIKLPADAADGKAQRDYIQALTHKRPGKVVYEESNANTDLIPVTHVTTVEPDGRRGYLLILEYQKELFIGEANVDMDAPPPLQFQQTFYMMDDKGNKIRLEGGEYDREEKTN